LSVSCFIFKTPFASDDVIQEPSANNVECWVCETNPTEHLKEIFDDLILKIRIESGVKPESRADFRKGAIGSDYPTYIVAHPELADFLAAMEKIEASCLTTNFWRALKDHEPQGTIAEAR